MRERSAMELMVLGFTFIVGLSIIAIGATVAIVEITNPETDTSLIVSTLMSLVSGILGALLGLLAGRADTGSLSERPHHEPEGYDRGDAP